MVISQDVGDITSSIEKDLHSINPHFKTGFSDDHHRGIIMYNIISLKKNVRLFFLMSNAHTLVEAFLHNQALEQQTQRSLSITVHELFRNVFGQRK